jgi:cytoskeleton protein RodZ
MALFTHRKSNGPDEAEREASLRVPQTIGSILRAGRLQSGKSLADAAAALRIRPAFLAAIEEDEPERLPGPAYAVGFVRTYAEYLGLDGEAVARRFKQDIAGSRRGRISRFPSPCRSAAARAAPSCSSRSSSAPAPTASGTTAPRASASIPSR